MKVVYANLCDIEAMSKLPMNNLVELIVLLTVIYRLFLIISFFNDASDILSIYLVGSNNYIYLKGKLKDLVDLCNLLEKEDNR